MKRNTFLHRLFGVGIILANPFEAMAKSYGKTGKKPALK